MTETSFWQSLRKKLVPRVYALKLNLRFVAGVPDCWLSGSEEDLWLELKYVQKLPPIVDSTKLLTALQQQWLAERYAEGRRVGALIGSSDGHLFFSGLSWQKPISREKWIQTGMTTKEMADFLVERLGDRGCIPYNSPYEPNNSGRPQPGVIADPLASS